MLKGLSPESVAAGKALLAARKVTVGIADVPHILYSEARLSRGEDWARVCIADARTNVILIDGETLFKADPCFGERGESYSLHEATAQGVLDFATSAPFAGLVPSSSKLPASTRNCRKKASAATTACTSAPRSNGRSNAACCPTTCRRASWCAPRRLPTPAWAAPPYPR